jgi:hypothetical protein
MKRIVIFLVAAIAISLSGCASRKYLTPVSSVNPGYQQTITDDEIRQAFENKPQLTKPLNIAVYDVGSVHSSFADSLQNIEFVKGVYEISPSLIENEDYYASRYRGWHGNYSSPPQTDTKRLRLLAAQGKADLLIILSPTHSYYEHTNFLAVTYFLLIPSLFVPGMDIEVNTEVDMFFIDVRNGFLYGTYHNKADFKNTFVNLYYWSDASDKVISKMVENMVPDMMRETREILSHPEYYITQE